MSSISVMWMASESVVVGAIPWPRARADRRAPAPAAAHLALDLDDRALSLRSRPGSPVTRDSS